MQRSPKDYDKQPFIDNSCVVHIVSSRMVATVYHPKPVSIASISNFRLYLVNIYTRAMYVRKLVDSGIEP